MPVDVKHPDYEYAAPVWRQNRDVTEGERAVKAGGEVYLPRLSGQDTVVRGGKRVDEYVQYLMRAAFFPATGRTVNGLQGLIARKDPAVEVPKLLEPYIEDINFEGQSLNELAMKIVNDIIITGRGGLLVEFPLTDGAERSIKEAEMMGLRPYIQFYPAERIIYWASGRVNGKTQLTEVRLLETYEYVVDEWTSKLFSQIHILRFNELNQYEVLLYRKEVKEGHEIDNWVLYKQLTPVFRGQPEVELPFIFVGSRDSSLEMQKALITDLASVNIQHFRNSADYENGLHWAGKPTPVFIGDFVSTGDEEVTEIRLGSQSGIHMTAGSDAKMLVASGMDLEALSNAMATKKDEMAMLGARIIAPEKKAAEAAETAAIHRAGESSVLAALAGAISKAITKGLIIMARWSGLDDADISFQLNKDFVPAAMTAEELNSMIAAWQGGAITKQELFEALVQGEIISSDKEYAEHEAELETEVEARDKKASDALDKQLKILKAQPTKKEDEA